MRRMLRFDTMPLRSQDPLPVSTTSRDTNAGIGIRQRHLLEGRDLGGNGKTPREPCRSTALSGLFPGPSVARSCDRSPRGPRSVLAVAPIPSGPPRCPVRVDLQKPAGRSRRFPPRGFPFRSASGQDRSPSPKASFRFRKTSPVGRRLTVEVRSVSFPLPRRFLAGALGRLRPVLSRPKSLQVPS